MRVDDFLRDSARRFPGKIALVAGEQRVPYRRFDELVDRLATGLIERGVRRGDRVVLFLENGVDAALGIFAALRAGAVFSPVHPSTKSDKLAYILNNCRATALITHARLLDTAAQAVEQAPSVTLCVVADARGTPKIRGGVSLNDALAGGPVRHPESGAISLDLAMVIYTSGSTGFPKGVMMTHQNIAAAATSITTYLENTPDDIILGMMPFSFDYGLYQLLMSVKVGATLVIERGFTFPEQILRRLEDERVTGLPIVPTIAAILLSLKDLQAGRFPNLRYLTNTAAALPPAHIRRLQELFPGVRIFSMYGLTECKRCTYLPPDQLEERPSSVGKAIPDTEAYVVDEEGRRVGPGVVGELVIRGAHVMKGYWENPEATDRMLRPGPHPWEKVLYTGDLFRTDEGGFLYFVGRRDDIIKCRGEKVSPKEVENVLYALEGVKEAAVVGVPDPVQGMALKAVIVPARPGGLDPHEVVRHCARHLEDFMVPRLVDFRSELPKTSSGKIRRSEVQAEELRAARAEDAS